MNRRTVISEIEEIEFTVNISDNSTDLFIVDDDSVFADFLIYELEKYGFKSARNFGKDIISEIAISDPKAIIINGDILNIDIFMLCKKISFILDIPILIIVSKDTEADIIDYAVMNKYRHIKRPFSMRKLVYEISHIINRYI